LKDIGDVTMFKSKGAGKGTDSGARAEFDQLHSHKGRKKINVTGDSMKGLKVAFSKNLINDDTETAEVILIAILQNSGDYSKDQKDCDIRVECSEQIWDRNKVSVLDSGKRVIRLTVDEVMDALMSGTIREVMESSVVKWEKAVQELNAKNE